MRRLGWRLNFVPLVVAALLLAGCDDDDEGNGPGADTGDASDGGGDVRLDTTPDTPDQGGGDQGQDPGEDPAEDPAEDAGEDPVAEVGEDLTEDGDDDATDAIGEDVADAAGDAGDDAVDVADTGDTGSGVGVLVISEVVEGPLPGGLPTWVELTNIGDGPISLSEYSLGVYNTSGSGTGQTASVLDEPTFDGGDTSRAIVLAGTLLPCTSYVVNFQETFDGEFPDSIGTSTFFDVYGVDPSNFEHDKTINGNDVIALFLGAATGTGDDATLVDVFGTIGAQIVADDNDFWLYADGYARRTANEAPDFSGCSTLPGCSSPTFQDDWEFSGPDVLNLDTTEQEMELLNTVTDPFSHECP